MTVSRAVPETQTPARITIAYDTIGSPADPPLLLAGGARSAADSGAGRPRGLRRGDDEEGTDLEVEALSGTGGRRSARGAELRPLPLPGGAEPPAGGDDRQRVPRRGIAGAAGPDALVIHGLDDTLITPSGGERTAALVPEAELLLLPDMGHDRPAPLWPDLCGAILRHTSG